MKASNDCTTKVISLGVQTAKAGLKLGYANLKLYKEPAKD
jgi:hypothetical protein